MMIGENRRPHPTIHIPPRNDPTVTVSSPFSPSSPNLESLSPLFRYLPSNDSNSDESVLDSFRMYEFKVRRCTRGRSHDWCECPFAHQGEKARRRDPRKYHYSGTSCPEFRKGVCRKGDSCEFSHGVFECWLHPDRYRTQPCKDGTSCKRRICFFAHTHEQLRVDLDLDLGGIDSFRNRFESRLSKLVIASTSPTSILVSPPFSPPSVSPPISPSTSELMRKVQLNPWSSPMRSGLGLPLRSRSVLSQRQGLREMDMWDNVGEEIPAMEVVESGKELRAMMYARLSRENSLV
ncbi:hypothetical protein AALP_AA6G255600 [Arabis alpina]|uniref:C3H1-type domain-containing protein n=1 Tax=Arabis alpina TaxID=50452 RepID=A0A087GRN1_ARAAL|nr:hypothetical protein AALP_AA6G255600 [Arabis alpina]